MKHHQTIHDFIRARRAIADVREFVRFARTAAEQSFDRNADILWHQFALDLDMTQLALRRLESYDSPSVNQFKYHARRA